MPSTSDHVPNMGKRDNMIHPPDIALWWPDVRDETVSVSLLIKNIEDPNSSVRQHWAIVWRVPHITKSTAPPAFRIIQITRERDKHGRAYEHFTNWGPMTKTIPDGELTRSRFVPLDIAGLSSRQHLERIAEETPVRAPPVEDPQRWVLEVLRRAALEGALTIDVEDVRRRAHA